MVKKILTLGIALAMLFPLAACGNKETPTERVERICGIELPKEMNVEYDYFNMDFYGSIIQYNVFELKEEPTVFLSNQSFGERMDSSLEKEFENKLSELKKNVDDKIGIPKEYYPDWDSSYLFARITNKNDKGDVYLLYFQSTLKLILYLHRQ